MRSLAAVSLLLFCNACFARHTVRPTDLAAFDGYAPEHQVQSPLEPSEVDGVYTLRAHLLEPGVLVLRDARDGYHFDFDSETELRVTANGQEFGWGTLKSAQVANHTLHAQLNDGSDLQAPLESIEGVETRKLSIGRSVALGIGLGVGTLLGLVVYGLANFHCHC